MFFIIHHLNKSVQFIVSDPPDWLNFIAPEKFNDSDLFKIVTFFVFQCPCKNTSIRTKSLKDYGWDTPWKKPYNLKDQLKKSSSNFNLIYSASSYKSIEQELEKANLKDNFPEILEEKACFYDSEKNQTLSLFKHIRNSFAHCRLNMIDIDNDCVFIMEDGISQKGKFKLSARIILKKSTLLKWITIIENGQKHII